MILSEPLRITESGTVISDVDIEPAADFEGDALVILDGGVDRVALSNVTMEGDGRVAHAVLGEASTSSHSQIWLRGLLLRRFAKTAVKLSATITLLQTVRVYKSGGGFWLGHHDATNRSGTSTALMACHVIDPETASTAYRFDEVMGWSMTACAADAALRVLEVHNSIGAMHGCDFEFCGQQIYQRHVNSQTAIAGCRFLRCGDPSAPDLFDYQGQLAIDVSRVSIGGDYGEVFCEQNGDRYERGLIIAV